ncbi:PEGA domain-containing protein [Anaeromyxobacter terrae]|uniref:PEGA domain-containing protein n=1 Tax=Anaeromyxobacter terrae TaxID=2925406 RepID=UPI001F57349B|nr:PEGA domain-containing protein [Anaeromyxobacter sp. SG22]
MSARGVLALAGALLALGASASERLGVIAVAYPPAGPDADLAELAHQLRAACRDRIGGVEDVPTMRARLLGQASNATLSELDRAYGGALAVYQNGEFESSVRTLSAIVEDLESIPESDDAYAQWTRALLRLAHAAATIGRERDAQAALTKLARTEPALQPEPDQYSPGYRRRFEEVKAKVRALPKRKLTVLAEGRPGVVYVNGRNMGPAPVAVTLPAGTYRIGGAAEGLRVPSFTVDLEAEDRTVVLDFALAESLRANAGPGLALAPEQRAYGIIRAGAWLGVDRLVVASRAVEGGAQFLLGSIYDVRRGALLREGSVRMVAGSVPAVNLGALASFLLTGQSSRDVKDRTPDVPRVPPAPLIVAAAPAQTPPAAAAQPAPQQPKDASRQPSTAQAAAVAASPARAPAALESGKSPAVPATPAASATPAPRETPSTAGAALAFAPPAASKQPALTVLGDRSHSAPGAWMRPTAIGSGAAAVLLAALALQQGLSASSKSRDADGMIDGETSRFKPGADPARYYALQRDADAARRNAYVSAGFGAALAAAAGVLGWMSWDRTPEPALVAFSF